MRHSDEDIKEAAARFDRLASEVERNPDAIKVERLIDLQAVAAAAAAVQSAQAGLVEAIDISRAHGRSWNELAVALNVSRQAARQRYGAASSAAKKVAAGRRPANATRKAGSGAIKISAAKPVSVVTNRSVAKKAAVSKRGRKSG